VTVRIELKSELLNKREAEQEDPLVVTLLRTGSSLDQTKGEKESHTLEKLQDRGLEHAPEQLQGLLSDALY
jgi:hypothetical protein